jgi:hygromycin-B 7''-O-kinase
VSALDRIAELDYYRQHFMDAALWAPYVREIARRHGLGSDVSISAGLPGTCPTFIVADRWVVKLYGELFDGKESWQVEKAANELLAQENGWPVPALLAAGSLYPEGESWHWPYLVFEYLSCASFGEQSAGLSLAERLKLAACLGQFCRRLHSIPFSPDIFPGPRRDYRAFLAQRRAHCVADQAAWGRLPPHLLAQLDNYLPPVDAIFPTGNNAHFVHGDLTRDHILGQVTGGRWETVGVIDFGDARMGDIYYELIALHLDLFAGDKRLLRAFLEAYGSNSWTIEDFSHIAMAVTLLFPFDVLVCLPHVSDFGSLEELANSIWKV